MNAGKVITTIVTLAIGIAIGFASQNIVGHSNQKKSSAVYIERHEGQSKLINPLLACDVAADVLSDAEMGSFKNDVEKYLSSHVDKGNSTKVSVYFRELNDGLSFSIGDTETYTPASLRKVPLMIALLKQAENEKNMLDRLVKFDLSTDFNLNQNIKPTHTLVVGNMYTIRDLIYRMIVYSDNNAFTFLTTVVNPEELKKVYSNLRILDIPNNKNDGFRSVQTYESFFRILYNASYLNRDASDWALEIMSNSEFKAGLVAGIPPKVTVSHKFGEHSEASNAPVQLHDCGIVYYPKHPYLLCVMSQGPDFSLLGNLIAGVSQTVYAEVDAQNRKQ